MDDIRTSARVTLHTLSTSVRSRSFIAQKASYWLLKIFDLNKIYVKFLVFIFRGDEKSLLEESALAI